MYIALKPCSFGSGHNYFIGDTVPDSVVAPGAAKRLMKSGILAVAPDEKDSGKEPKNEPEKVPSKSPQKPKNKAEKVPDETPQEPESDSSPTPENDDPSGDKGDD